MNELVEAADERVLSRVVVDRARRAIASDYGLAATVPEYRAVLNREGASGPEDVAAIGDETAVARHLERLANAGATELVAAPFGATAERDRTLTLLAELNPGRNSDPPTPLSDHDRAEIHELIALHGHLADDRRAADLGLLLTPDAVYDLREFGLGQVSGLPAIQAPHEQRPGDQPLGHHVTNVQIEQPTDTIAVRSRVFPS